MGDDDEGDDGGEFGSGDRDVVFGADSEPPFPSGSDYAGPSPSTEGVYPADADDHTTKKAILTTTTKRPAAGRASTPGKLFLYLLIASLGDRAFLIRES